MAESYGFIGLGIMGSRMAANLLRKNFKVKIWNRDGAKCEPLLTLGAQKVGSPREVAAGSDITFAMVSDPAAAREVCFGAEGVAGGIGEGRGYVDMSTVDDETSRAIAEEIVRCGGRFLEAPVSGTKKPAEDGTLVILAAGDQELYRESIAAFEAMGKKHLFLGEVGNGARMKLVVNLILGDVMAALSEGMALGKKAGLSGEQLLEILEAGALSSPMIRGKGALLLKEDYTPSFPLKHLQKDLRLAVALGDRVGQPLHCTASANEVFKRAVAAGHGDEDIAAVHQVSS